MKRRLALLALLAMLLAAAAPASAGELRVHYAAIQKMLLKRFFVTENRAYVQGSPESPCNFALLEEPEVFARDARLVVRMKFRSRFGTEVRDRCVGTGDEFAVSLSGVPTYGGGKIYLADPQVETEERGYSKLVAPFVTGALGDALSFPLQERIEESSQILWAESGVAMTVPQLEVPEIRLGPQQMTVRFDFRVDLR